MQHDDFIRLMGEHRENLNNFQSWMRAEGVAGVKIKLADVNNNNLNVNMNFIIPDNGDIQHSIEDGKLKQVIYGAEYEEGGQEMLVSPLVAVREIIRFSVSVDDFTRSMTVGHGATLVIPDAGPIRMENGDFQLPKQMIN